MAKHYRIEKKKKNKLIYIILIILVILAAIYLVKHFYDIYKANRTSNLIDTIEINEDEISDEVTERMLQVKTLKETNSDIVGWLEIENTKISYPVLQGEDNDFYMTHDYKKEYTKEGSLFLDKDYDWNLPSSNLLIYGHNNIGSTEMFADLLNYKEESYYKEHPSIRFTTENEDAEYEIIAVFESRVYYKSEKNVFRYYYFINAENEEEYNEFVSNAKEASLYDTGKTAEHGDQLMTLSTCAYHTEDGRFAVVAKKVEK